MSYARSGRSARPLLPDDLEGRLVAGILKAAGTALVGLALAGWLSLLTWSAQDPSLTHTVGGSVGNWLGPLGAVVSDLLLQTLGFSAILFFLAFAGPGLELIVRQRVPALRLRLGMFPLGILAIAGALSSLPTPASWPMLHGLGGIAGDAILGFARTALAIISPDRAGIVAGVCLATVGCWLLSFALGMSTADWQRILLAAPSPRWKAAARTGREAVSRLLASVASGSRQRFAPSSHDLPPAPDAGWPFPEETAASGERQEPLLVDPTALDDVEPIPAFLTRSKAGKQGGAPLQASQEKTAAAAAAPLADREPAPPSLGPADADAPNLQVPQPSAAATETDGKPASLSGLLGFRPTAAWRRPSLNLLKPAVARPNPAVTEAVLRGSARLIEETLAEFGIKGAVRAVRPGPVVTRFEVVPAEGSRIDRIVSLSEEFARAMAVPALRITELPGTGSVGIDLPNVRREPIAFRGVLESEAWRNSEGIVPLALGRDIEGQPVVADLAQLPHLLVAGGGDAGPPAMLHSVVLSVLFRHPASDCRLLLLDSEAAELGRYAGLPHLLAPVVKGPAAGLRALQWVADEMDERYKRMAQLGVRSAEMYNNRVRHARKRGERLVRTVQTGFDPATGQPVYQRQDLDLEPISAIVVVVQELADLMAAFAGELEGVLQRIAPKGRAVGVHLVVGTSKPVEDVLTPAIRSALPNRIALRLPSKAESRVVIDQPGAEQLLDGGDMLLAVAGHTSRVHGAVIAPDEVDRVASAVRAEQPRYSAELLRALDLAPGNREPTQSGELGAETDEDDLFDRAVAIVQRERRVSTTTLQRRLALSYAGAVELIGRMEAEGLVSPPDGAGRRRVLLSEREAASV